MYILEAYKGGSWEKVFLPFLTIEVIHALGENENGTQIIERDYACLPRPCPS